MRATSYLRPAIIALLALAALLMGGSTPAFAATFTVNSTADAVDASPGDTLCETATLGECTLRAAIQEANALASADKIDFSVTGIITPGSPLPRLTGNVMIVGPSATTLAVDANATGRVFETDGGSMVMISDLTITGGNSGNQISGGGIVNSGTLTLTNSTVSGNSAIGKGGGIANFGTLIMTNSTISGNTAGWGGGGIFNAGPATLTNSTISANSAGSYGGGIYVAGFPPTLKNTIVGRQIARLDCDGFVTSLGHNLDSDGSCGLVTALGDRPNTNPQLVPLALNPPGSTKTHALCTGINMPAGCGDRSPAIDTGDNAGCPATDQRGVPRPQGAACDIGAYEVQVAEADVKKLSLTVLNPPATIDVSQNVTITLRGVLHNNGSTTPVDVIDRTFGMAPPDCTLDPPQQTTSHTLDASQSLTVDHTFTIHCSQPSFHTFVFANCVELTTPGVIDPDPSFASNCRFNTELMVAAIAYADLKKEGGAGGPPTINVSETGIGHFGWSLHNNGPFGPVDFQEDFTVSTPPDCTTNLTNNSTQGQLQVSTTVDVRDSFTFHCTTPSFHTFEFCNVIRPKDQHVIDPDPTNNGWCVSYTVEAIAYADAKIFNYTCDVPAIDVSVEGSVTCTKVLHNNGPFGPVTVSLTPDVSAPPDCIVTLGANNPLSATLEVSETATLLEEFLIHCFTPSLHTFEFCNEVDLDQLHVVDPDPTNNKECVSYTMAAIAYADLKVSSPTCNAPPQIDVSANVLVTCKKTVHNNGPFGPAAATDVFTASAPPDCSVTAISPFQLNVAVSMPVGVTAGFTIHCTTPSFHTFEFCNVIRPKDRHVIDPDPTNNKKCVTYTVAAIAYADVKIVAFTCNEQQLQMGGGVLVSVECRKTLHNNGPFSPVTVTAVGTASVAQAGCVVTNPPPQQVGPLTASTSLQVQENFAILCIVPGPYDIEVCNEVKVKDLHVEDPNPSNNVACVQLRVAVFAEADVKVTGVTVDCDDPADVNTPFDCQVDVTVHNNGPTTPVNTDVTVGLSLPPDCTASADQTADDVSLVASSTAVISKTFQAQCSLRSFHDFTGTGAVQIDQLHVRDPDPSNNSGSGDDTVTVFDLADAKLTAVTIDCPATADANTPFTCAVDVTVHSNGPTTPVDAGGAVNVGVPDDCTVAGYTLEGQGYGLLSLDASVSQNVSKGFNITCTASGLHEIVGCAIVQVNQLHVRDPVPIANNYGTDQTITDIEDPAPLLRAGRCTTVDPPEICGNGIDDDADTLIDEEPDTDRDGINNCDDPDDDNDGYADVTEAFVGTDPLAACPWIAGVHPAWPPDFDDSQSVDIVDVLALKPVFGSTDGDGTYAARNDLDASGDISIVDVLGLKPHFGTSCTS